MKIGNFFESLRPSRIKERWQRRRVYEKIRAIRKGEQSGDFYIRDRSAEKYLYLLDGFHGLLKYGESMPRRTYLDIGAGTTRAVSEIKNSGKYNLSFYATVLTRDERIGTNLGFENTRVTSVEELRGVPDSSISVATAAFSLPYVASAELAAKSIDRVLEPGGILKASMVSGATRFRPIDNGKEPGKELIYEDVFVKAFEKLGYEVERRNLLTDVILVRKPGGELQTTLSQIISEDLKDVL